MIIANPLYDVVFKYLLEDIDIAREMISTILGEEITHLEVKPQETATEVSPDGDIRILRFDFKATVVQQTGELKKVLIELQKIKLDLNIMRFRRYLGDNYGKEDAVIVGDGTVIKTPLPIVTIYILGFPLDNLATAVVKVQRQYKDVLADKILENVKADFVELLTHDSYFIQVRLLPNETKSKLERILQIFNPRFKTEDLHKLDFTGNTDEPIVQKMVNRLQRAIVSDEVRRKMDFEDEFYDALAKAEAKKDVIIAEKDQELREINRAMVEKDQALIEKEQALVEKDREIEDLLRQIARMSKD
jgi:hypothetical protein